MNDATPFRVAVLGDSVVWGQGLARDDVYATRGAGEIAESLGRPMEVVQFSARSGAKMAADPGEAEAFVERYPHLASHPDEVEDAASNLHGEVPCTFPTVGHQLDTLIRSGSGVDLLVIGGGANDMNFKDVLDPRGSPNFVASLDPELEERLHRRMLDLLLKARRHFPREQIMVPGYYPGLSDQTDRGRLREMLEHFAGAGVSGWINYNVLLPVAITFTNLGSVSGAISRAKAKAAYGHSRGLYWLRRAVADCNAEVPPGPDSPPVVFIHAAFGDHNALFTGHGFQHEEYEAGALTDAQAGTRAEVCPNSDALGEMQRMRRLIRGISNPQQLEKAVEQAKVLLGMIEGPRHLVQALEEFRDRRFRGDPTGPNRFVVLDRKLASECERVKACRMAAFFHPNALGARRYAERMVARWNAVAAQSKRPSQPGTIVGDESQERGAFGGDDPRLQPVGPGDDMRLQPVSGEGMQLGVVGEGVVFDPDVPDPEADEPDDISILPVEEPSWGEIETVDSIAVRIRTAEDSAATLYDLIELDLGTGQRWRLDHFPHVSREDGDTFTARHFRPGESDLFTLDPLDGLNRSDIRYCELHRVPAEIRESPPPRDELEAPWIPERIELELNGAGVVRVDLHQRRVGRGRRVVLPYPMTGSATVPNIRGMRFDEARERLERAGLRAVKGGAEFSSDVASGRIASQRPDGGEKTVRGGQVRLVSSRGPLPVEEDRRRVPEVTGMRNEEAISVLNHLGFRPDLSFADSDRPFGIVIGQVPDEDTPVQPGSTVRIFASKGPGRKPGEPERPGKPGGGRQIQ